MGTLRLDLCPPLLASLAPVLHQFSQSTTTLGNESVDLENYIIAVLPPGLEGKPGLVALAARRETSSPGSVWIIRGGPCSSSDIRPEPQEVLVGEDDCITALLWVRISEDWAVLNVGCKSGAVKFFDSSGRFLLSQRFRAAAVKRIKLSEGAKQGLIGLQYMCHQSGRLDKKLGKGRNHGGLHFDILILHDNNVLTYVCGKSLSFSLLDRATKSGHDDSSSSDGSSINKPKWLVNHSTWQLQGQAAVEDVVVCEESSVDELSEPRISLLGVGSAPVLALYFPETDSRQQVSSRELASILFGTVATSVASNVLSFARSWVPGAGGGANAQTAVKPEKKEEESVERVRPKVAVSDGKRWASKALLDPTSTFTVTADSLGRVMLVDAANFVVVRMWKGYRDAQVAWICAPRTAPEHWFPFHLLIFAPWRGLLELWSVLNGDRVAALNVGVGCVLTPTLALNRVDKGGANRSSVVVVGGLLVRPTGEVFEVITTIEEKENGPPKQLSLSAARDVLGEHIAAYFKQQLSEQAVAVALQSYLACLSEAVSTATQDRPDGEQGVDLESEMVKVVSLLAPTLFASGSLQSAPVPESISKKDKEEKEDSNCRPDVSCPILCETLVKGVLEATQAAQPLPKGGTEESREEKELENDEGLPSLTVAKLKLRSLLHLIQAFQLCNASSESSQVPNKHIDFAHFVSCFVYPAESSKPHLSLQPKLASASGAPLAQDWTAIPWSWALDSLAQFLFSFEDDGVGVLQLDQQVAQWFKRVERVLGELKAAGVSGETVALLFLRWFVSTPITPSSASEQPLFLLTILRNLVGAIVIFFSSPVAFLHTLLLLSLRVPDFDHIRVLFGQIVDLPLFLQGNDGGLEQTCMEKVEQAKLIATRVEQLQVVIATLRGDLSYDCRDIHLTICELVHNSPLSAVIARGVLQAWRVAPESAGGTPLGDEWLLNQQLSPFTNTLRQNLAHFAEEQTNETRLLLESNLFAVVPNHLMTEAGADDSQPGLDLLSVRFFLVWRCLVDLASSAVDEVAQVSVPVALEFKRCTELLYALPPGELSGGLALVLWDLQLAPLMYHIASAVNAAQGAGGPEDAVLSLLGSADKTLLYLECCVLKFEHRARQKDDLEAAEHVKATIVAAAAAAGRVYGDVMPRLRTRLITEMGQFIAPDSCAENQCELQSKDCEEATIGSLASGRIVQHKCLVRMLTLVVRLSLSFEPSVLATMFPNLPCISLQEPPWVEGCGVLRRLVAMEEDGGMTAILAKTFLLDEEEEADAIPNNPFALANAVQDEDEAKEGAEGCSTTSWVAFLNSTLRTDCSKQMVDTIHDLLATGVVPSVISSDLVLVLQCTVLHTRGDDELAFGVMDECGVADAFLRLGLTCAMLRIARLRVAHFLQRLKRKSKTRFARLTSAIPWETLSSMNQQCCFVHFLEHLPTVAPLLGHLQNTKLRQKPAEFDLNLTYSMVLSAIKKLETLDDIGENGKLVVSYANSFAGQILLILDQLR